MFDWLQWVKMDYHVMLSLATFPYWLRCKGPSIYAVHTEGRGSGSYGRLHTGEGVSAMWTSTQKIRAH